MITVIGRVLNIPKSEKIIGFIGDNKIESRMFEVTDSLLFDFDFKLDIKSSSGEAGIVDLSKTFDTNKIILTWNILEEHIPISGMLYIQLRAFDSHGLKWHSAKELLKASESINATEYFPSPLPSEFKQMETRVTNIQADVTTKAIEVDADRAEVATNTQIAIDKALEAETSAINAKMSEDNAKESELLAEGYAEDADGSKTVASQALADLLAMLGTDIATLTNGKLTPSQIPPIAITNTFIADAESAMLELVAETGDICIRTDESKTYILQVNDPTVLENWKHLKVPTNYADEAGNAQTAEFAEDSNKINGKRLITMTESQYESAVLENNTLYAVYPDEV